MGRTIDLSEKSEWRNMEFQAIGVDYGQGARRETVKWMRHEG